MTCCFLLDKRITYSCSDANLDVLTSATEAQKLTIKMGEGFVEWRSWAAEADWEHLSSTALPRQHRPTVLGKHHCII